MNQPKQASIFNIAVIVAALGYFVDIYDLLLFGIIRLPSLRSLGLSDAEVTKSGESILQWQMWGLLIGGFIAGLNCEREGPLRF